MEAGGDARFQTTGAGGGDGRILDPNAALTGTENGATTRGKTVEKSGDKDIRARPERFDKEARAIVEGKASRFFTGPARKELEPILGELREAKGDAGKTAEAMGKLRALVAKHRRDIDALGEGLKEGITEEGKRIIAALEKAETEGGDVHGRTLEILADTTVATVQHIISDPRLRGSAIVRVLRKAGLAAGEPYRGPIGLGPKSWRFLVKHGVFRSGDDGMMATIRTFNEILVGGGAEAADLALRTLLAIENAGVAGIGQIARELGESEGMVRRLERDLRMLAEVAALLSGRTPMQVGHAVRKSGRVIKSLTPKERARRNLMRHLNLPEEALNATTLEEVLGVAYRRVRGQLLATRKARNAGKLTPSAVKRLDKEIERLEKRITVLSGLFNNAKGLAGEKAVERWLRLLGLPARKATKGGKGDFEILDETGEQIAGIDQAFKGLLTTTFELIAPGKTGKRFSFLEVKVDAGTLKGSQPTIFRQFTDPRLFIKYKDEAGKLKVLRINRMDVLRLPLDRVPEKLLVEAFQVFLEDVQVFSKSEKREMLTRVRLWRKKAGLRRAAGKTVGPALTVLGALLTFELLAAAIPNVDQSPSKEADVPPRKSVPSAPIK